jgi:ADP-ribose pyrophosphatase YjhB (NUDIX family)
MPAISVSVAVIREDQILLTKRADFEIWCLPSGEVEAEESIAQAAIREAKEETGLDIELRSLVGIYSRVGALPDSHAVLFTAVAVGGRLQTQPGETIDVRYFSFKEIPNDLSPGHQKRIEDAISGTGGSVAVIQETILPVDQKVSSEEIMEIRTQSREARLEFYRRVIKPAVIQIKTEVGGDYRAA